LRVFLLTRVTRHQADNLPTLWARGLVLEWAEGGRGAGLTSLPRPVKEPDGHAASLPLLQGQGVREWAVAR
jgi:hypothetical protein